MKNAARIAVAVLTGAWVALRVRARRMDERAAVWAAETDDLRDPA